MKVLVISTSLRNNSNSNILADEFIKGAKENGHEVEKISLRGKKISFCTGCDICQTMQKCALKDDVNEIVQKMHDAEVLVFAAPVYFGGVSGQMQTLLDRTYPLFPWKPDLKQTHKFRDVYLITTSAGEEFEFTDLVIEKLENWINHFNGHWLKCSNPVKLAGVVRCVAVHEAGEVHKFPDALKGAFKVGSNVGRLKPNDKN